MTGQTEAGRYTVNVYYRGRDRTAQTKDEMHQVMGMRGDYKRIEALQPASRRTLLGR